MERRKVLRRLVGVGWGAILLVYGSSISAQPSASSSEEGWNLYKKPSDGFSIALPPTWREIETGPQTPGSASRLFKELNPEVSRILEWQERNMMERGVVFLAYDWPPKPEFFASVGIQKRDLPVDFRLDDLVKLTLSTYERIKFIEKPISNRRVNLGGSEAERLQYRLNMTLPTGEAVTLDMNHYLILKGLSLYQVLFSATAKQAQTFTPIFEKIAQSFQWVE